MILQTATPRSYARTLVRLGRVSNLPTVWSNCLVGWTLGGGGGWGALAVLCLGATLLYLGGMFLNDAFDADFDGLHRRDRPIPSGQIGTDAVWRWGFGWLGGGTVVLVLLGNATGAYAALLLFTIVFYDAVHKLVAFAPVLMGCCRFFLYLVAASVGQDGVTGLAIWSGFALAAYITGLSVLARRERGRTPLPTWPVLLLFLPILLALLVNTGEYLLQGWLMAFLVSLWLLRSLQPAFMTREPNVYRAVEGLLAGVVLIDYLALGGAVGVGVTLLLLLLFLTALVMQRLVPAN